MKTTKAWAHLRATLAIPPDEHSHQVSRGRWMSFIYALAGLLHMARYAKNLRIQALAALAVLFLGLYLGLSGVEWAILAIVIALNILAEFMNAAIEAAVNLASPDYHPMAQVAKDVAAGGVLVSSLLALLIAGLILWPPLRQQLLGA